MNFQIELSNSVGVLFTNCLLLPKYNERIPIELESINKIRLIKKEALFYNFISFLLGVGCLLSIYFFSTTIFEVVLLSFISLVFLIASFKINKVVYFLVITKSNIDFFELKVDKKYKNDAKQLVLKVNKKIRKKSSLLTDVA